MGRLLILPDDLWTGIQGPHTQVTVPKGESMDKGQDELLWSGLSWLMTVSKEKEVIIA